METKSILIPALFITGSIMQAEAKKPNVPDRNHGDNPNVLLLYVDDLKPNTGCFGDKFAKTPNIDALGAEGTVFSRSYCQQALSGPTRVSCMTGLRPDHTLIWNMPKQMREYYPGIVTLPQYFAYQGYETAAVGKIFDPRTVDSGHDELSWTTPYISSKAYFDRSVPGAGGAHVHPETVKEIKKYYQEAWDKGLKGHPAYKYVAARCLPSCESADVPDNAYIDGATTLAGIEELEKLAKSSKPFFMAIGYARPHLPFNAPTKYWDMYNREDIPLAPFQEKAANSPQIAYHGDYMEIRSYTDIPALHTFCDNYKNNGIIQQDKQRELIHGYYACISYVDKLIGDVISTLKRTGQYDNTIIVLIGDHGWHLGDHGLWAKATNFEHSTRAPLIIRDPRIKSSNVKQVVEFVDVFPTVCSLCNIIIPDNLDGTDLSDCMRSPEKAVKDYAVSQFYRGKDVMGYSIRTNELRYTVWLDNSFRSWDVYKDSKVISRELYDYTADPDEARNVTGLPEYMEKEVMMRNYLEEYMKQERIKGKMHNRIRPYDYTIK